MVELPDVPVATDATPAPSGSEAPAPASAADNPNGSAPDATATPATPSPSASATPEAEPKFEIKVDGKVESLTRAEIVALAQQGKSYTQKTQKLADEQRRWEAERQAIIRQEREKAIQELRNEEARKKAEAEKDPATRATERVEALEQRLEDQQLDLVVKSLLSKYEVDEQQFLIEASKAGCRSAADVQAHGEEIAKALSESQSGRFESRLKDVLSKGEHPEIKALKDKWLADYLAKKGGGPSPVPPAQTPTGVAAPKKARTLDEAADIAEEMLTGRPVRH